MLRREMAYFFGAIRFFTRLPVPGWVGHSAEALARSARYFPAVGLLIGAISALVYLAATFLWPVSVAVLLAMAASIYATGAFHEDGLSDTVDGLGGGWDKQQILEIMKDSRVGSYGVLATVLALLGKFSVLSGLDAALIPFALLAGHALSRFCASLLLAGMDYVRAEASSKAGVMTRRPGSGEILFAGIFVLLPLLFLPFEKALAGCALAGLVTFWLAARFRRCLGGYTGDCLGATQQVSEIAFYLGLLANWVA